MTDVIAALSEAAGLIEALKGYTLHKYECEKWHSSECDCGLRQLLVRSEAFTAKIAPPASEARLQIGGQARAGGQPGQEGG